MLGSKSKFFLQSDFELQQAREKLFVSLKNLERSDNDIRKYLKVFDYFCLEENKRKFDGATASRDLFLIRHRGYRLDIDAAEHDYDYLHGANRSFIKQWKADISYLNKSLKNGKNLLWKRFLFLRVLSIAYIPYRWIEYKILK